MGSLASWTVEGGTVSITSTSYEGNWAASFAPKSALRYYWFPTSVGVTYRFTAWVRVTSETGSDWGGFRLVVQSNNWAILGARTVRLVDTPTWTKIEFDFQATTITSLIDIGQFSGANLNISAIVDSVSVVRP